MKERKCPECGTKMFNHICRIPGCPMDGKRYCPKCGHKEKVVE